MTFLANLSRDTSCDIVALVMNRMFLKEWSLLRVRISSCGSRNTVAHIGHWFIFFQNKFVKKTFYNLILSCKHCLKYNSDFYCKNPSCAILSLYNSDFYYKNASCENLSIYNLDFYCKNANCENLSIYNSDFCCKNSNCENLPVYKSYFSAKIRV